MNPNSTPHAAPPLGGTAEAHPSVGGQPSAASPGQHLTNAEHDDKHLSGKEAYGYHRTDDASSLDGGRGTSDPSLVPGGAKGKIVNPLSHLSKAELLAQADAFIAEKGLEEHSDVIKRGALVAQSPAAYGSLEELSTEEKDAITYELGHKWSHPFTLYFTIVTCSIGAAVQGWDQTGSNGANLSFPAEFGIGDSTIARNTYIGESGGFQVGHLFFLFTDLLTFRPLSQCPCHP